MESQRDAENRTLARFVAVGGMMLGMVAAGVWALESWQRPLVFLPVNDAAWLAFMIGGFAIGVVSWPGGRWWHRGVRVVIFAVIGAAMAMTLVSNNRARTVDALMR